MITDINTFYAMIGFREAQIMEYGNRIEQLKVENQRLTEDNEKLLATIHLLNKEKDQEHGRLEHSRAQRALHVIPINNDGQGRGRGDDVLGSSDQSTDVSNEVSEGIGQVSGMERVGVD